jgi:hypothetical protein
MLWLSRLTGLVEEGRGLGVSKGRVLEGDTERDEKGASQGE